MKITKFGHCCLLIEENGLRILTDPGSFTTEQNNVRGIDAVLITHEHNDHLHVDSLKKILENNPQTKILTNHGVGRLLAKERIVHDFLEDGERKEIKGVLFEGFGREHQLIYPTIPVVQNTGYFINNRFFYPGDAFVQPLKAVEILALPVAGPWLTIGQSIDYAKSIGPKIILPVHDAILKTPGVFYSLPAKILEPLGVDFLEPEANRAIEL